MEITWAVYNTKPEQSFVFNFLPEQFIGVTTEEADLSFMPKDVISFQWDKEGGQSFLVKEVDGQKVETELTGFNELGVRDQIEKIYADALKIRRVPPWSDEDLMQELRMLRDEKLSEVDFLVLKAVENGETPDPKVVSYRRALRDLPKDIESGKVPKPTCKKTSPNPYLDDYELVFNSWPEKP